AGRVGRGMTVRLLLADDQAMVRAALAALLSLEPDFEVVAEVGRGDQVVAAAAEHRPDVALLDIEMPGLDGLAAAAALAHTVPDGRVSCAGRWSPVRSASWSRTPRPNNWPTRCAGWRPASGWSTRRWRRPP